MIASIGYPYDFYYGLGPRRAKKLPFIHRIRFIKHINYATQNLFHYWESFGDVVEKELASNTSDLKIELGEAAEAFYRENAIFTFDLNIDTETLEKIINKKFIIGTGTTAKLRNG